MPRAGGSQEGDAPAREGLQLMGSLPTLSPTSGSHYSDNTHRWENVLGMFFHSVSRSQNRGAFPHSLSTSTLGQTKEWAGFLHTHARRHARTHTHSATSTQPLELCSGTWTAGDGRCARMTSQPVKSDKVKREPQNHKLWTI